MRRLQIQTSQQGRENVPRALESTPKRRHRVADVAFAHRPLLLRVVVDQPLAARSDQPRLFSIRVLGLPASRAASPRRMPSCQRRYPSQVPSFTSRSLTL